MSLPASDSPLADPGGIARRSRRVVLAGWLVLVFALYFASWHGFFARLWPFLAEPSRFGPYLEKFRR